jgi:hypothetical protein
MWPLDKLLFRKFEILIFQISEFPKQELIERPHSDIPVNSDIISSTDRYDESQQVPNEFVDRSSILTKANFSYYHPVHKKYYYIAPDEPVQPPQLTIIISNDASSKETQKDNVYLSA